jgi:hypothetical protein
MKVTIRRSTGVTFSVVVVADNDNNNNNNNNSASEVSVSVLTLKQRIADDQDDLPVETQRLIYKGRILDDAMTLASYGIINDATLHLVKGKTTTTTAASTSAASTTASTTSTGATRSPTTNNNNNNNTSNTIRQSPQQQLLQQQMQMQQQMQQPPNPEQIAQMMNSPMLQSLLEQPDFIRTMMEMNPQMRDLMQQNPQLREVFNNPELMRQSLQQMRDPNAMRNAMRNQELAMSQIENMPGNVIYLPRWIVYHIYTPLYLHANTTLLLLAFPFGQADLQHYPTCTEIFRNHSWMPWDPTLPILPTPTQPPIMQPINRQERSELQCPIHGVLHRDPLLGILRLPLVVLLAPATPTSILGPCHHHQQWAQTT